VEDDEALVARARRGDETAYELLVRRHTPAVWRFARSFLADDFAAEEAVQDTFVSAFRGLAGFRGESSVRTWLLAICRRTCLDRLRRRDPVVVPLDRARHERAVERDEAFRVALEQALRLLPPDDREAFTLVDVLGYRREEAARVVGVPASTMRSRVSRARSRLATLLDSPEALETTR
jgi:RNA polymerase sigma-70 factor, ECF subfamily